MFLTKIVSNENTRKVMQTRPIKSIDLYGSRRFGKLYYNDHRVAPYIK